MYQHYDHQPESEPRLVQPKLATPTNDQVAVRFEELRPLNLCRACGEDFGSVTAFDAHRVGKHAYEYSPQHPDGRRCLTLKEMTAKSFKLNTRGAWSTSTFLKGSDGT